ncbi:LysR family transcriptional regulator [Ferribacterium limneticum]|nr:LysR family transcriptional regulator [Ferribacterium limneticum]
MPSALSHAVAKLEGDLGITLFLREGRKAMLNQAGRTRLDDGRHLLRAASELAAHAVTSALTAGL